MVQVTFSCDQQWVGFRFDINTVRYNASSDTGPVLRHVVIDRAGVDWNQGAITIEGNHPLVSHVTLTNTVMAFFYTTSALSVQLDSVTVVGGGRALSMPCSSTICTLEECFIRGSTFSGQMYSLYICITGPIFAGRFQFIDTSITSMSSVSDVHDSP